MSHIKLKKFLEVQSVPTVEEFANLLRIKENDPNTPRWVQNRLAILGLGKTCGRCGGTGNYSFRPDIGTTCLKCGGTGKIIQKLTRQLYDEAQEIVKSGKLEEYINILRLKKKIKDSDISTFAIGMGASNGNFFLKMKYTDNRPDQSDPFTGEQFILLRGFENDLKKFQSDYSKYFKSLRGSVSDMKTTVVQLKSSYEKLKDEVKNAKEKLMQKFPDMRTFFVDPEYSPGGKYSSVHTQPGNKYFYNKNNYDDWMKDWPDLKV